MPETAHEDKKIILIFFAYAADLNGHALRGPILKGTLQEIVELIAQLNRKELPILWIPRNMCTGWRTTLTHDECLILFAGSRWTQQEMAQANARLTLVMR